MYFTGDTVYEFFKTVSTVALTLACVCIVRCAMFDLDIDYICGSAALLVVMISWGMMYVAHTCY